jgi:integrase
MKSEKNLTRGGLTKYECALSHLKRTLGDLIAERVSDRVASDFVAILLEHVSGQTAKTYLYLIAAGWDWAKGRFHVAAENPWKPQISKVKVQPAKREKPFSEAEIRAILTGFKSSKYYSHYYPVVMFLAHTAVRPGEAFGLRWRSVADDCSHVVIREVVSRGERRDRTKTGKTRVVYLSPSMQQMLCDMPKGKPDSLVFFAPKEGAINDKSFNQRAWKTVLQRVGVLYRRVYNLRHTAISHALFNNINPVELSEQTGHDKKVLLSVYAHAVKQKSLFVEFNHD